ncbi:MAG: hypothetical protein RRA32_08400, partial [bacterium]|nr:hypothetical protein [bacterium]
MGAPFFDVQLVLTDYGRPLLLPKIPFWTSLVVLGRLARIIHDGDEMSANCVAIKVDDFAKSHQRAPRGA